MQEFCTQEGLTLRTLEKWYRRGRRGGAGKEELVGVKAPSGAVRLWAGEVEVPKGMRLAGGGYGGVGAAGAPDSGVQHTGRPPQIPQWLGGGGEECVGGGATVGQSLGLPQSPGQLLETRGVGSHGLLPRCQAVGARAVSRAG